MHDTFELLRRAAEESRAAARQLHGGIDSVSWESLLDRVEDQLEEDDRDGDGISEPADHASLHSCTHTGLPVSLFASGALGAALVQPAVGATSSGNKIVQCLAAGAALAGLGLIASPEWEKYRSTTKGDGVSAL